MTPVRWQKVEELFQAAVAEPLETRAAFLQDRCDGDESLHREVEALLVSDQSADGELEEITSSVAADWANQDNHAALIGQTVARYHVLAAIGSGGMGEIYLAQDTKLDRKVALKFLPRRYTRDGDRLRRFEQEARAASALNHPNIVTIYETGDWDGAHFIAAEYVEGETLREQLDKGSLPVARVLEIGCQTAGALAAAHAAGIMHRDIKPANIMFRKDGYIKVVDFGLAKLATPSLQLDVTEPGRVMGTINYMSPEQAMGKPLDHRTDIFSLGVVLYELATGRRLFEGESEAAVYDSILHRNPPPMRDFAPAIPTELDQVVRRALEKEPARRYQSATDLRADLKRLAHGTEVTEAARIATRERGVARRARLWRFAAMAAVLVSIVAGALFLGRKFAPSAPDESARKSIAVLPFAGLSSDEGNSFFADGVHDQVLTDLGKIAELKVIGRTSILSYKAGEARNLREISQQLGARYILEGTVQRVAGKVRVNAQLSDAKADAQVWAETYDSDLADVFAIQSNIAKAIAKQLHAKISAAERSEIERKPTSDVPALELYTRGKSLIDLAGSTTENSRENLLTAVDVLNQALRRDDRFVLAYCELARAHDDLYVTGLDHSASRYAAAQAAIDAALRVAPASGDTHLAVAWHLYAKRDSDRAQQEVAAARAALPNDPRTLALSGYIHRRIDRWQESTAELEKAVDLDPRNPDLLQGLSANYHALHNYTAYVGVFERAIALTPNRIGLKTGRSSAELLWRADPQPLHRTIETILREEPQRADELVQIQILLGFYERDLNATARALAALGDGWWGNDHRKFSRAFGEGLLARLRGDEAAAQGQFATARMQQERVVQAQPDYAPAISMLGLIDAQLGRKDDALREGRRAVELLPVTKDSMTGRAMIENLAKIAGAVGESELALELVRDLVTQPAGLQYGHLKLDPLFDPLRSDPRFEEIVASIAPQT
jgi:TolB-like protein/Tfp pilus assembly protein PilF